MRAKLAATTILALVMFAMSVHTALAISDPDTQSIITARGYGDVLETGDILLLIHYDIDYTSVPTETANQSVLGRYLDNSVGVRDDSPFVFVRSGYGQGLMSIYFSAAEATSLSIAHGDADSAQIIGNPALFPSPWTKNTSIVWRDAGSQSTLESDIRSAANAFQLQTEWAGVALVSTLSGVDKLTTDGEEYFENAVPNLRQMAPNVFSASLISAEFLERDFDNSYATTLENAWQGTRLENSFTGFANWLGMPEIMLKTMTSLGAGMALAGALMIWTINRGVSTVASGGLGVLTLSTFVGLSAFQGMFSLQFLAVTGFMGILLISFMLWLKRA